jgi:Site-specific recombinase XerD
MRGNITKRGERSWRVKFDVGRDPVTGRRLTRYVTVKGTKKDAQQELTRLLSRVDEGSYVDPTKMTVAEYLRHWLKSDIARRLAAKTAQRHGEICEHYIIPRIGALPLRKLTGLHIEAMEADLQKNGRKPKKASERDGGAAGGPLSMQTVKHVHRTLSQALKHAVSLGILSKNPAQTIKAPKVPQREIRILLKEEIPALLRAARGSWLYAPVVLGVTTGMRRGEILGLRWRDIDMKAGVLTVQQTVELVGNTIQFKSPKTARSRRTIDLPAFTVEALREHKKNQAEDRLKMGLGKDDRDLVFTRPDGSLISPNAFTKGV